MLTIKDLQSVKLFAETNFNEWKKEAEAEFYKPSLDLALGMWWAGLSDEEKEKIRQQYPEEIKTLEQYLESEVE